MTTQRVGSSQGVPIFDVDLPRELNTVQLMVLSDLHIGDSNCNIQEIRNRINTIKDTDNMYCILNGDIINNATKMSVSDVYADTLSPTKQIEKAVELFTPIKDKILLMCDGNHEARSYKAIGISPTQVMADKLDVCYTTTTWYLFLSFGRNNGRDNRKTVYSIYGCHGSGGGKTISSKAGRLEKLGDFIDADCIFHSHTHTPLTFKSNKFRVDFRNRKVKEVEQTYVNTNAFLDYGGYGAVAGFSPANKSTPVVELKGKYRDVTVRI